VSPSVPGQPKTPSELLAAALDASTDAIALVDPDGRVLGWNSALADACGLDSEALAAATVDVIDTILASLGADDLPFGGHDPAAVYRNLVTAPDGRLFERIEQIVDLAGGHKGRMICFRPLDLAADPTDSERQQLRSYAEQRRHALRMEAVGRLAGGIAHDFNNMLTVMIGFAEQLESEVGDRAALRQIVRAAQRAADLTRQLLAFSRQQVLRPRTVALSSVVRGMGEMLGRLLGDDVRLAIDAPEDLPNVCADPAQLEQIVLNLAINARDAMERGGRLGITVRGVTVDGPQPGRAVQPAGKYVRLVVSDSGTGIAPELLHKVFEPFFTTKGTKGTGLGLSTVYGIVKQSGGYIWVESQVDGGTTFTVDLPVSALSTETGSAVDRTGRASSSASVGGGRIVVVEDLDAVRELTREMLESDGFEVLEAASARQALEIIDAAGTRVDLVLSDVMMPEMTGRELADAIRSRRPDLPVLFMSGLPRSLDSTEPEAFLAKPFTRTMLLSHVRARLASTSTTA
jgi:two-component system cell cycle sensor histidine kinase/response regulator CckA